MLIDVFFIFKCGHINKTIFVLSWRLLVYRLVDYEVEVSHACQDLVGFPALNIKKND